MDVVRELGNVPTDRNDQPQVEAKLESVTVEE
jgi:hypothetical protein